MSGSQKILLIGTSALLTTLACSQLLPAAHGCTWLLLDLAALSYFWLLQSTLGSYQILYYS